MLPTKCDCGLEILGGRGGGLGMVIGRACDKYDRRNWYRVLVRKRDGKTPLGRPTHRWKGNTKIYRRRNTNGLPGMVVVNKV